MPRIWNGYRWVDYIEPAQPKPPGSLDRFEVREFDATKSLGKEPGKCDVLMSNLSEACCPRAEHGDGTHEPTCANFRGAEAETAAAAGVFDPSLIKRAESQPIGTVETMDGLWLKTECEHRTAYQCVACKRRFCMTCDALLDLDGEHKTAVRWCPAAPCVEAEAKENGISVARMISHRILREAKACVVCGGPHDVAKHETIVARRRPTATTTAEQSATNYKAAEEAWARDELARCRRDVFGPYGKVVDGTPLPVTGPIPREGDPMKCRYSSLSGHDCKLDDGHAGDHDTRVRVDRQSEATPFDLGDVESDRVGDSTKKKDTRNG